MNYRPFGKTGEKISALGFGSMRLPITIAAPGSKPDLSEAVTLLRRGFAAGINYVDTAYFYCDSFSENAVGEALAGGWRDKVLLSTKLPLGQVKCADDFWRILEHQLEKLQTDHIDFYHLHAIGGAALTGPIKEFKIFDSAAKARDRKMIRHFSFSFHDKPEAMKPLIDTGEFSSVLCQYNLLDPVNSDMISYAASQGLGTVAMGPVGGGRLAFAEGVFENALGGKISTPELALRYALSHPDLCCALSGMSTPEMVDQNCAVASSSLVLSPEELRAVEEVRRRCAGLRDMYCTGCAYCVPECSRHVNIPVVMEALIYHRVYGFKSHALNRYRQIGHSEWVPGADASACVKCGKCEKKCPQHLKIRQHLAEALAIFAPPIPPSAAGGGNR